jgi:hypothetical protein
LVFGRQNGDGRSLKSFAEDASEDGLQGMLSKESDDLMLSQDKSSLKSMSGLMEGTGRAAFSDKQMRKGLTETTNAKSLEHINRMTTNTNDRGHAIIEGMSGAQVAKIKSDTVKAYEGANGAGSLRASVNETAIKDLENPQNAQLVAAMSGETRAALNLRQDDSSINVPHGGGGAPAPSNTPTPEIKFEQNFVDPSTGASVTANTSGADVMRQIGAARPAQEGEVNGSKQYWENAVGSLSNEQLQTVIQQNAKINTGAVKDAHYDQLAKFARKHLTDRGLIQRPPSPPPAS